MKYYVNDRAQDTGEHEVHREACSWLPSHKTYLGDFSNCADALRSARTFYSNIDGCYYCCRACHTR